MDSLTSSGRYFPGRFCTQRARSNPEFDSCSTCGLPIRECLLQSLNLYTGIQFRSEQTIRMQFMIIEHFRPGFVDTIYERFNREGRMLPKGLRYVDSWLTADRTCCFQLMETDDETLFSQWTARWSDLIEFEIIELCRPPENSRQKSEHKATSP